MKQTSEKLLINTRVSNCYTGKNFYRLSVKLTREEWNMVKSHFKYYNFDGLKGWATTKPLEVAEILVSLRVSEYKEISEKIEEYERLIANHGENDWILDEYVGGRNNLKYDLSKLVSATISF